MIERLKAIVCKSTSTEDEKFMLVEHNAIVNMFHKVNEIVDRVNELENSNVNKIGSGTVNCRCSVKPTEYVKFGKWISVKDRLPEGKVLCFVVNHDEKKSFYDICNFVEGCYFSASYFDITHWMPLPELPEVGVE